MRLVSLTGLVLIPSLAHAQVAPTRIAEAVSCASCRVTLSTVATLGDTDGPGELTTVPYGVRVDGRGRYWLWGGDAAGGPPVYDATGRFLRTTGRRGQGPGEFEGVIDAIPLPGDSVLVIDQGRRATLFAPDLRVARHISLGATLSRSLVVNWPRSVIGFDHYGAGGRGGPVFHEMAFDSVPARVTRSFGPEWSIRDFRTMTASMRITAPTTSGFWAATHDQYRIERWSFERAVIYTVAADGIPRLRIVRFTLEGRLSP